MRSRLVVSAVAASAVMIGLGSAGWSASAPKTFAAVAAQPSSQTLRGSGSRGLSVRIPASSPLVVTGRYSGSSNFIVHLVGQGDDNGLFNVIGTYTGQTALATMKRGTYRVAVQAEGTWSLTFAQPGASSGATTVPGTLRGYGSRVVQIRTRRAMQPVLTASYRGSGRLAFLRGTIQTVPCGVIYTMKPDGSDQRRFAGVRLPVCFPSWSRDGKKIAFVFSSGKPAGIYAIDSDGRHLRRLTAGPNDTYPAWSPDGGQLLFTRKFNLEVLSANGSRLTALTHATAAQGVVLTSGTWSPDGRRIAFQANRDVYVLALGGRKVTALGAGSSPSWSPDGKRIVFVDNNGRLELTSPDGGKARPLVAGDGPASWSPDGRKLAFWRFMTGIQSALYVVNIDGSGEQRISRGPYDTTPAWLPH